MIRLNNFHRPSEVHANVQLNLNIVKEKPSSFFSYEKENQSS